MRYPDIVSVPKASNGVFRSRTLAAIAAAAMPITYIQPESESSLQSL